MPEDADACVGIAAWKDKVKDTAERVKDGVADTAHVAKKHGEEMHKEVKCTADDHVCSLSPLSPPPPHPKPVQHTCVLALVLQHVSRTAVARSSLLRVPGHIALAAFARSAASPQQACHR